MSRTESHSQETREQKSSLYKYMQLLKAIFSGTRRSVLAGIDAKQNWAGSSLSRRSFMIGTARLGAGLLLNSVFGFGRAKGETQTDTIERGGMPEGTEVIVYSNDLKVYVDSEHIPVYYSFITPGENEKLVAITEEDKWYFKGARSDALTKHTPQCAEVVWTNPNNLVELNEFAPIKLPSPEHPYILEKPKDILTDEELLRSGVQVHQHSDPNCPELYFRNTAPSNILAGIALLNKYKDPNEPKENLDIYMVNAPFVCIDGLSNEQKSNLSEEQIKLLHTADETMSSKRTQLINTLEKLIKEKEEVFLNGTATNQWQAEIELADLKAELQQMKKLSAYEIFYHYGPSNDNNNADSEPMFVATGVYAPSTNNSDTIYYAFGTGGTVCKSQYVFTYLADGSLRITSSNNIGMKMDADRSTVLHPRIDGSYLSLEEIQGFVAKNGAPEGYMYGATIQVGTTIRHEIFHAWATKWLQKLKDQDLMHLLSWKGELAEALKIWSNGSYSIRNERLTDYLSGLYFNEAHKQFEHGNDEMYDIVLTVKPTKNNPAGGYMITENQTNSQYQYI